MSGSEISVIVFDLGNVLIPFDYSIIINKLNGLSAGLGDKFAILYKDNYEIHRKYERGDISNEEFISTMLDWVDNKLTGEEFCVMYSDIFKENTRTTALLPLLKQKYKLVLLSNTNFIHQKYGWEKYSFLNHFDKLILSHEVGFVKPESGIYNAAEKFTKELPEKHLFIDDVREYVEGALKMGWNALQFTGHDNLMKEFIKREIITG